MRTYISQLSGLSLSLSLSLSALTLTLRICVRWNGAKRPDGNSRLLIYDSLFRHTHIVRKLTFLGVQKCGCVGIGYPRKKVVRARSLNNGSILYEEFELRNEVAVTFPTEGIFITPAAWHNINLAGYRAVALTQTQSFSSVPP